MIIHKSCCVDSLKALFLLLCCCFNNLTYYNNNYFDLSTVISKIFEIFHHCFNNSNVKKGSPKTLIIISALCLSAGRKCQSQFHQRNGRTYGGENYSQLLLLRQRYGFRA